MALEIQKEIDEIRSMYAQNTHTKTYRAIIYGSLGSGKTNLLRTCRQPVHVDSFDPGGTMTIRDAIDIGQVIADTRYEIEDPASPTAIKVWDQKYHERKRGGYFSHMGTYCIDSATTWSDAFANQYLATKGRPGGYLYQNDYNDVMSQISTALKDILTLPCDVILICHEDAEKDEGTGRMWVKPLFIGKQARIKLPLLFDEIYYTSVSEGAQGSKYQLLTRNTGLYQARTRLGKGGIFDQYEKPDIKALMKKAGFSTEDKPLFK